jgi:hypothetical protein
MPELDRMLPKRSFFGIELADFTPLENKPKSALAFIKMLGSNSSVQYAPFLYSTD